MMSDAVLSVLVHVSPNISSESDVTPSSALLSPATRLSALVMETISKLSAIIADVPSSTSIIPEESPLHTVASRSDARVIPSRTVNVAVAEVSESITLSFTLMDATS